MGLLSKRMLKYLLSDSKAGYSQKAQSTYNWRLVKYAQEGLKDLKLLAEKLPEKQQAEIFNEKCLLPFVEAVLTFEGEREIENGEIEKRKERLLSLLYGLLMTVGSLENAEVLAPEINQILKLGAYEVLPEINCLKAILLKGFFQKAK